MSYLKCSKHGTDLECMGGCSAHPDNWYCPKCDAEDLLREEYKKEFNASCASVMGYTLTGSNGIGNIKPTYTDKDGLHEFFVKNYNPYDSPTQRQDVIDIINARGVAGPLEELIDEVGQTEAEKLFIMASHPPKINFVEDGDYLIFANDPLLPEEKMDDHKETLVNAFCAKIMGYTERPGNNDKPLYYDEDGFYIGRVEDYKPWDDLIPLKEVANIFTEQTGLSPDNDKVAKDGMLSAYRDFLLSNIVTEDDIEELKDEKINFERMGGDPTNINWQAGRILVLVNYRGFTSFYSGCTDEYFLAKEPDSSDGIESIEIDSFNDNGLSQSNAIEGYIRDPANGLELWERAEGAIDTMGTTIRTTTTVQAQRTGIIRKCLEMMAAEYMSEEDKFNDRCRRIVSAYGEPCTFVDEYNPYDNVDQLAGVIEIVIIEAGKDFLVDHDTCVNFTEEMRAYVKWYGSEEYIQLD